jgi:hypothetical protein
VAKEMNRWLAGVYLIKIFCEIKLETIANKTKKAPTTKTDNNFYRVATAFFFIYLKKKHILFQMI